MAGEVGEVISAIDTHLQGRKQEVAILVIDPQWDFTEFGSDILTPAVGAVPVPGSNLQYMQTVNELTATLKERLDAPVWVTQEPHQSEHVGAMPFLRRDLIDHVFYKEKPSDVESHSAFRDAAGQWNDLAEQLRQAGHSVLVVYGLATDFSVLQTMLDARELSFEVWWIQAGSRGIFIRDSQSVEQVEYEVLQQMRAADVHIL